MSETAQFFVDAFYALDDESKDFVRDAINNSNTATNILDISDSWKEEIKRISNSVKGGTMTTYSREETMEQVQSMFL